MPEPNVTAIMCSLNGHQPAATRNQADSMPRPVTCGCGERSYTQQGFMAMPAVPSGDSHEAAGETDA